MDNDTIIKKRQKILVIVESPNKVAHIQEYLKKDIDNDYIVLATKGHIADLITSKSHKFGVDLEDGFKPKYALLPNQKDRLSAIINAAIICDKILMATDEDREGECIASLVADRIITCKKPIKRVMFKKITEEGILDGIKNEIEINENLVSAAKARRVLDRIVGFMASPMIIQKVGTGTSAGRVQSVALRLIIEREREIENFKPENYFVLKSSLYKDDSKNSFTAYLNTKNKITEQAEADDYLNILKNAKYKISKIVKKPKPRPPIAPLNTAKLQIVASNKTGLSPTEIMECAQRLFENGMITYHRTDSVRAADEAIVEVREWIGKNHPNALPKKSNIYKNKNNSQDAHEGIRPIKVDVLPQDNPKTDLEKVYKVIWDVFVASQMAPAIYDTTSITIKADDKYELKANGRMLKTPGWLILTNNTEIVDPDEVDDKDELLPVLDDKDILINSQSVADKKHTNPPSRYKQPTLVATLEARGIGRPSTYASIGAKILERNFVMLKKDVFHPTEIGYKVVDILKMYFSFMEYDYTAEMESNLDKVENGELEYADAMGAFYKTFVGELNNYYKEDIKENHNACEICDDGHMILRKGTFGYFIGCSNYPKCTNTKECDIVDKQVVVRNVEKQWADENTKCPRCSAKMYIKNGFFGEYYCCEKYPSCRGSKKIPYGKKCPNCDSDLFRMWFSKEPIQGAVLGCTNYPACQYLEKLEEEEGFHEKMRDHSRKLANAQNQKIIGLVYNKD